MQRTLSKTDMQTHIDRLTNYSTNISSQKVFFAKLKDKYHTFNEMQSPKDYEDEEEEESFEPAPMLEIAIDDDEVAEDKTSELERGYRSKPIPNIRPLSSDA